MPTLITGIRTQLAQLTAAALASTADDTIIGIDSIAVDPSHPDVVCTCISDDGPTLTELLEMYVPQTLIHLDQPGEELSRYTAVPARAGQLQTLELLGLCASRGVEHVVLRSSTLVYGASAEHPLFVGEDWPLSEHATGLTADYLAIEGFAREISAQHGMAITILRCAGVVGPGAESPLLRYLHMQRPPMMLGFAPRIQALHVQDAALAFALAAMSPADGLRAFNIAANAPLPLDAAIRRAGRKPQLLPSLSFSNARLIVSLNLSQDGQIPWTADMLRYGCCADLQRAKDELGWVAQYSTADAIASSQ